MVGSLACLTACGGNASAGGEGDSTGPIKIMQIAPYQSPSFSLPFMKSSIEAAAAELNEAGGINGRKVTVVPCDSKYDPNEELRCAQKAVQEKAAAVVGGLMMNGAQALAVLGQAKIPSIGADAITPDDAKSPASFLFDAGLPGYAAMPAVAKEKLGATRIATFNNESATVKTNNDYFKQGAKLAGVKIVSSVTIPNDAVDYSQFVARAEADGAQAIVSPMTSESNLKLFKALGTAGSKLRVVLSASSVTPNLVKEAGSAANGSWLVQGTPNAAGDNQWGAAYVAAMEKYEPKEKVYSGVGLRAYYALRLFAQVMEKESRPATSANVWDAFSKVSNMKFAWIDDLDFTKPGPVPNLPRVVSSKVFMLQIKNGKFVPAGDMNPF
ncbi:ABC transporter substrate-binding protein [Streptomyces mexicanus]|uniref:ABC transporter substrate-binding protein n=1 Tax=Streptomyces mexicanus TaxID=178566 RepID=A0A7X1LPV9_9ACTN|nr:ABC transporter substrate-binding protein [Streptomyces mexicanus]MBC2864969.1 ABC transporter substrate-binding protein [Streptomyces mexicanus]